MLIQKAREAVPLSVVILTLDEEVNLPHALRSVAGWAREIVVLDSGSTDRTEEIANQFGARFVTHRFENYSRQRNFALRELPVEHEWVLFLDADEWIPDDLKSEIAGVLSRTGPESGFFMRFRLVWMGTPIRFGYRPAWVLRLVRRAQASCDARGVNEHLTVTGATGYLSARFVHEDRKDISDWIRKHDRYATFEAARLGASGDGEEGALFRGRAQRTRWIRTHVWRRLPPLVRPWIYFVMRYVVLGGFLDGRAGFTFHFLQALWYQTLIDMKAASRRPTLEDVRDFWQRAACGEALYLRGRDRAAYDEQARVRYALEPYIARFAGFTGARGQRVLEIGLGLGADHQRFSDSGARLFGVDITARSVAHVKHRLALHGLRSSLQIGNAESLAFRDGVFDVVYSWGVLHHAPDTQGAVREVLRVLKPGGCARVMVYHRHSLVLLMLWVRYALLRFRPVTSLSDISSRYLESPGTKAYSVSEARDLFSSFRHVEIETVLTHGDLLSSAAGQRHRGPALSLARALWPRRVIRACLPRQGLFMLIRAVK